MVSSKLVFQVHHKLIEIFKAHQTFCLLEYLLYFVVIYISYPQSELNQF